MKFSTYNYFCYFLITNRNDVYTFTSYHILNGNYLMRDQKGWFKGKLICVIRMVPEKNMGFPGGSDNKESPGVQETWV